MQSGHQSNVPKEILALLLSIIQKKILKATNYNKFLAFNQINTFMAEIYYMAKRDLDAIDNDLAPNRDILEASLALVLLIRDLSQSLLSKNQNEIKCFYNESIKAISKLIDNFESTKEHLQKQISNGSIAYTDGRDNYTGHYVKEPISGSWSDSGTFNEARSAQIDNYEAMLFSTPKALGFSKRFKQLLSKLPFLKGEERPEDKNSMKRVNHIL